MRYLCVLGFVVLLAACGRTPFGPARSAVHGEVVKDITVTPSELHAGDDVLVDVRVADRTMHINGGHTEEVIEPSFTAESADYVPLYPDIYTPGAALPGFEEAHAAALPHRKLQLDDYDWWDMWELRQGDHYYFLLRLPDTAGPLQLSFRATQGGGFSSDPRRLTVNVLP